MRLCAGGLALLLFTGLAHAVVQFEITNPVSGASIPGQTVTIIPPGGGTPFEATDDDNDGIIILPDANGSGWTARYSVNGEVTTVSGQVVTAAVTAGSGLAWGVLTGVGVLTASALSGTDSGDGPAIPTATTGGGGTTGGGTTGGGTTGGGTTGGGTTGGGTTGGGAATDLSCDAIVNITASNIVNPGGFIDAPNTGDMTRVTLQGTTTLIFEIDVPNLAVDATLTCTTLFEDPQFVGDYSVNDCSGSASGTFNGQAATMSFTNGLASVVFDSGLNQSFLIVGGADMDVQGLASPYSTSFVQFCP